MCGIVGATAQRDVAPILLEGLRRLEYRGYDSAGIAVINPQGELERQRAAGKVKVLADMLDTSPLPGKVGIAHTRWATHGKPSTENAHPIFSHNRLALVHNGIIENHERLKEKLITQGYQFDSETDTEIVAHLLHATLQHEKNFTKAFQQVVKQLEGAYALAVIDKQHPDRLWVVKSGCPLVIGLGIGENFAASDYLALLPVAQRFIYLEENDTACIERHQVTLYNNQDKIVQRKIHTLHMTHDAADRGTYRHYMLKEIFEQPEAIIQTLEGRIGNHALKSNIFGHHAAAIFAAVKRIQISACGTSYHAGLIARYWLEELAGIPCQIETASELRYRQAVVQPDTLFISLSQSGETADTLASQRIAKTLGYIATLAICNVAESSLVRNADLSLMMHAGPEIGVASTKAFTSQLVCLFLLTIALGKHTKRIDIEKEAELVAQLKKLPKKLEETLHLNDNIHQLADFFEHKQHALFIGRGLQYPVALEGALKLKEISYIHAEGYPGGELKHGPLALLDKEMPVIVLAPQDGLTEKLKSNIQEIRTRGAQLIIFADPQTHIAPDVHTIVVTMPACSTILSPIVYTLPLQLLAYHAAVLKGTDVDQPRNLAKSVTVE